MGILCESYCSHGGRCTLTPGHEGVHDSDYCTWTDAEALTRTQADTILRQKPGGADFLQCEGSLADLLEALIDGGGDEES